MTRRLLALAALLLFVAGCDGLGPASAGPEAAAPQGARGASAAVQTVPEAVTINGYTVTFLGEEATAAGTRFTYHVTGVDPGSHALDWFFLENACGAAPTVLSPSNAVDPAATVHGIAGVKWTASVPAGHTGVFSYTFAGAERGVVRAAIQRGGVLHTAALPGPCGGYLLEGSVFVNGDADPARSAEELGLANVRVDVYQDDALVTSDVTGPHGSFSFLLAGGSYDVRVPVADASAFNGPLYASYTAPGDTEPASQTVTLTADVAGIEFGFTPDGGTIIEDLEGAYRTQARDLKFWKKAVRRARRDASCDVTDPDVVCRPEMADFLAQIFSDDGDGTAYLLADPYRLPAGADPFDHALHLLATKARTELEIVTQNLFAMELNRLNGWGTPDERYDDALMSYLEGWVARGGASPLASVRSDVRSARSDVRGGGGGGGGVEETITAVYLGGGGGGGVEE